MVLNYSSGLSVVDVLGLPVPLPGKNWEGHGVGQRLDSRVVTWGCSSGVDFQTRVPL